MKVISGIILSLVGAWVFFESLGFWWGMAFIAVSFLSSLAGGK